VVWCGMAGTVRLGKVRFDLVLCGLLGQAWRDRVRSGWFRFSLFRQAWLVRCDMVRTGWVFSGRLGEVGIGVVCKVLSGRRGGAGYGRVGFGVI